jgi:hypothetical protein
MAIDPPWRLDPLKKIVGVGWGGGNVLVLRIETRVNDHTPRLTTLEDLQFTDSLIDAYAEAINQHDDHVPAPDIVNPMDGDMRAHTLMWNRPPYKLDTAGDESSHTWKAIVFLNLSRVRSFLDTSDPEYVFTVHFPASEHHTEGGTVYWAFADPFGNPFEYYLEHPTTTGAVVDADDHTGVVNTPIAFGSESERAAFLGWNAGSLPPWHTFDEPSPESDLNDALQWDVWGGTYKKRNDFPTDEERAPLWDEDTAIAVAEEHAESVIATPIPTYVVTVTLNLDTLEILMAKA